MIPIYALAAISLIITISIFVIAAVLVNIPTKSIESVKEEYFKRQEDELLKKVRFVAEIYYYYLRNPEEGIFRISGNVSTCEKLMKIYPKCDHFSQLLEKSKKLKTEIKVNDFILLAKNLFKEMDVSNKELVKLIKKLKKEMDSLDNDINISRLKEDKEQLEEIEKYVDANKKTEFSVLMFDFVVNYIINTAMDPKFEEITKMTVYNLHFLFDPFELTVNTNEVDSNSLQDLLSIANFTSKAALFAFYLKTKKEDPNALIQQPVHEQKEEIENSPKPVEVTY